MKKPITAEECHVLLARMMLHHHSLNNPNQHRGGLLQFSNKWIGNIKIEVMILLDFAIAWCLIRFLVLKLNRVNVTLALFPLIITSEKPDQYPDPHRSTHIRRLISSDSYLRTHVVGPMSPDPYRRAPIVGTTSSDPDHNIKPVSSVVANIVVSISSVSEP